MKQSVLPQHRAGARKQFRLIQAVTAAKTGNQNRIKVPGILDDVLFLYEKLIMNQPVTQDFSVRHRLKDQRIATVHAPFRPVQYTTDRIPAHSGDHDRIDRIRFAFIQAITETERDPSLKPGCPCGMDSRPKRSLFDIRGENAARITPSKQFDGQIAVIGPDVDDPFTERYMRSNAEKSIVHNKKESRRDRL